MQRYFAKNIEKEKVTLKESDIHHIKNVMRMNIHNKIEVVFNKRTKTRFNFTKNNRTRSRYYHSSLFK